MVAKKQIYPVLPLRDIVVYPKMIVPLFVGREKSIKALQKVVDSDQNIILPMMFIMSAQWEPSCSCCGCRTGQSRF